MTIEKTCEDTTPHEPHIWTEEVPLIPGLPVTFAWALVDYVCRGVSA